MFDNMTFEEALSFIHCVTNVDKKRKLLYQLGEEMYMRELFTTMLDNLRS